MAMQAELTQKPDYWYNPIVKAGQYVERNWFNGLIIFLGIYIFFHKDISIEFNLNSPSAQFGAGSILIRPDQWSKNPSRERTGLRGGEGGSRSVDSKRNQKDLRANDFSNLVFILNPGYADRHDIDPDIVSEKFQNCKNYIRHFLKTAKTEKKKYGIPVSITLAQGLLESNAGKSRLAMESNNHFGIKCRAKCRGCTCRNYSDDDVYDMFRVFDNSWSSYREHSVLLTGARYRHLLDLDKKDYKAWARGLKKAGYATDKRYAEKLIRIIETLKLYRYD